MNERSLDKQPYTVDEMRVCRFLQKMAPDVGCGDDPIGFLIASYGMLIAERRSGLRDCRGNKDTGKAAAEGWIAAMSKMREAIEQALDDMADSLCVCEDTKQQLIEALAGSSPQAGEAEIARAICCPPGCLWLGDSEDGEKCFCDTSDYRASKIETQARAVLKLLNGDDKIGE